ncbi:hypothetical protein TRV_07974, partial [Trichophyton verrucosum HKI 0517]
RREKKMKKKKKKGRKQENKKDNKRKRPGVELGWHWSVKRRKRSSEDEDAAVYNTPHF